MLWCHSPESLAFTPFVLQSRRSGRSLTFILSKSRNVVVILPGDGTVKGKIGSDIGFLDGSLELKRQRVHELCYFYVYMGWRSFDLHTLRLFFLRREP